MASDPIKSLLNQALTLLGENRPEEAIGVLDQIGEKGEEIPDQLSYRGLALAKLGQNAEAERVLRRAVNLAPSASRHHFTLAVQLRGMNRLDEAREEALKVRQLDDRFPGLKELLISLGLDASPKTKPTLRDRLFAPPLEKPAFGTFHAFPALEQSEKPWTTLGWILVVLSFVPVILTRFHMPLHRAGQGEQPGLSIFGGAVFNTDPLSLLIVFLFVTVGMLCVGWMVTDMLDRRARVLWIIPLVPFCCLGGLPGIGQAIYMGLGRK